MLHATITADPAEAAIAKASGWVETATPLIKAYLALDDAEASLLAAARDARGNKTWNAAIEYDERICRDAAKVIEKTREALYETVEGIRTDHICDEWLHGPREDEPDDDAAHAVWDAQWDASKAFNERLEREVTTADAAVHLVGGF